MPEPFLQSEGHYLDACLQEDAHCHKVRPEMRLWSPIERSPYNGSLVMNCRFSRSNSAAKVPRCRVFDLRPRLRLPCCVNNNYVAPSSDEDAGRPLDEYVGPGLQLMEQKLELSGHSINLIVPRSSDAVIDYYIDAGEP